MTLDKGDVRQFVMDLSVMSTRSSQLFHTIMTGKGYELDSTEGMILLILLEGGPFTMAQISNIIFISPPNVTRKVKKLTVAGLLKKKDDPRDERKYILELTVRGRKAALVAQEVMGGILSVYFDGMSPEETAALCMGIHRIVENLTGNKAPAD